MNLAPLYGLVLAGGASSRMGRDKALLEYHGRPQVDWAVELLSRHCSKVFLSVRPGQSRGLAQGRHPEIRDAHAGIGPIAGIAAAQAAHPEAAWLVLACDLPFVSEAALRRLVSARGADPVVAFRSSRDGLPEPLCAIYEPSTRQAVLESIASGRNCPRKLVIRSGVPLLDQPDPGALDNVNTPEELAAARGRLPPAEPH